MPVGEAATSAGKLLAAQVRFLIDEFHEALAPGHAEGAVVRHVQGEQGVCEPHDAQADLAIGLAHLVDLGQGISVRVDHVIKEPNAVAHRLAHGLPINFGLRCTRMLHEAAEIQAAEIAGLMREQGLLAAGVGGFDAANVRRGIVLIDSVDENDSRLARLPGVLGDDGPNVMLGVNVPLQFLRQRAGQPRSRVIGGSAGGGLDAVDFHEVAQIVFPDINGARDRIGATGARVADDVRRIGVGPEFLHPGVGHLDRDVVVRELIKVLLGVEEFQDVGMMDVHHAHVGPAAESALLDRVGGFAESAPERDWSAGGAAAGLDVVASGT